MGERQAGTYGGARYEIDENGDMVHPADGRLCEWDDLGGCVHCDQTREDAIVANQAVENKAGRASTTRRQDDVEQGR